MDSIIGNNVIIHSGTTIGSDGYGYIQDENNNHNKVSQIGNVIIEDFVEIGSNVCIDRGTIGSTIIKKGTKIDNLVHIAHNVVIGERNLIIAQVGIAGSTQIGNDVIIAGQSGINGHLKIGNNCIIMGRSGVTKNLENFSKVSGFPAKDYKQDAKEKIYIKKIPEIINYIKNNK
jgi:UDP-3-O-[3-hydroxymyristoyl] glucosamine N-acyltransferase